MATIRTAIELQDNFTSVLYQVISAVNLSIATMDDMRQSVSSPIDTASIDAARYAIDQATIAARRLGETSIQIPAANVPSSPAADAEWQSYPETSWERYEQEIAGMNSALSQLGAMQSRITQQANESEILPPQAAYDVENLENRMQGLMNAIQVVESESLDIGTEEATAQLEGLRVQLGQLGILQNNLNAAMQGMDVGDINETYLQMSQSISNMEQSVRDMAARPVEIPIRWETNNLEVFTNTGVERFQQEVQDTNILLGRLQNTQNTIAQQAYSTTIFPSNMSHDLTSMATRVDAIRNRIETIQNNPLNIGTDTANRGLEQLRGQLHQALMEQENLSQAMARMDVSAANETYIRLNGIVGNTEQYIRDNTDEQGHFNQEIEQGTSKANGLVGTIQRAVAAYASIRTIGTVINISDQLTNTTARLNLMNDGLQTTQDLQNMIYLSAERSRASYQSTADMVSKLGLMAGNAFGSSQEVIAFAEQLNKQFVIAGTSSSGISAAMLQLTQAMGAGVLRGEEYNSVLEQAPNIVQSIASYIEGNEDVLNAVAEQMGMKAEELAGNVQGQLKNIAAEGLLSAELVKAAVFAATDETNEKFESMPQTFAQIWTSFQNSALMAFQPVLQRMNEIANSTGFQNLVNNAISGISMLAGIVTEAFDLLVRAATVVADNWSWIAPIIYGVAGALAVYYGAQVAANAVSTIGKGIHVLMAVAQMAHAAMTKRLTAATARQIASQNGLNTAMYACPIVWIVGAIMILIAAFYAAVAAINKFAHTSVSATGIIAGAFMVLGAYIINTFVVPAWNLIATFANFIGNVFNDPIAAVKVAFYDMCLTVIGYIQNLAAGIETLLNKIPGVTIDITSGLDRFYSDLEQAQQAVKDESGWVEYVQKMEYIDYSDAAAAGYAFGKGIDDRISNLDIAGLFGSNIPNPEDYPDLSNYGGFGDVASNIGDTAKNTAATADALDITDEELKSMRDMAEREIINRFTTAELTVNMGGITNQVNSNMDLDGIGRYLEKAIFETLEVAAEGEY